MTKKICVKCGLEKPHTEFYRNNSLTDKIDRKCKICKNKDVKEWYDKRGGKEKQKQYSRKSYEKKRSLKPPKVKKEKVIKSRVKKQTYNTRIYLTVTDSTSRKIEDLCQKYGVDRTHLIGALVNKYIDGFEYVDNTAIKLQPININDFKIDGYSVGIEE